eukprot:NODE_5917_length_950_cov_39.850060_g5331_i0.p1 GENE.NODE_5917_length_950_cov_39.850060_g5331_i0~~NODE_5917_length_950_cov_39.850060_g5331_i0.p1  ORF type:complete len:282 (-),score=63.47 NODE_5917_length_950_cov_39.850060_g5331_i0:105-890(-)
MSICVPTRRLFFNTLLTRTLIVRPYSSYTPIRLNTPSSIIKDGVTYSGQFINDRLIKGHIKLPDGRQYEGEFDESGHLKDEGVLQYPNGIKYKGQFKNWMRDGKGRTSYQDSSYEEGTYQNDSLTTGKIIYNEGDVAELNGSFINGQLNGDGSVVYRNGTISKGNFVNGLMEGDGQTTLENGAVYVGKFINGSLAEGWLQLPDGGRYEGQFNKNGEFHGQGRFEKVDRTVMIGDFENGEFKDGQVIDEDGFPVELVRKNWT